MEGFLGFRSRLSELASCGFDFVNPLDLEPSTFVVILNGVFARRVENAVDSVFFLVEEYVVVGHAEFVFRGRLELF